MTPAACEGWARPFQTFTSVDLADYLALRSKVFTANGQTPNPADEVAHWATKALGQAFRLNAAMFDLSESDCVVFTESAVALACATEWDSYYRLRQRLRHKDGMASFLERNFFTLADWLPNNAWLLEDITAELGPTNEFEDVVYRKRFPGKLQFGEDDTPAGRAKAAAKAMKIASVPEKETTVVRYIARGDVPAVLPKLRTGDRARTAGRRRAGACSDTG